MFQSGADFFQLAACVRFFEEVDFFFRKIQRRLDQHAQVDHLLDHAINCSGKLAGQRLRRRLRGGFGRCFNQIGNRFRLRQIELVMEEGTMREFPRLRQTQVDVVTGFDAARQQHLHHDRPAVAL